MYLAHYGIKGQKWGVRRFQNPDGSYTNEGRKRYRNNSRMKRSEKTAPKIQRIIDSMNDDEKDRLGLHPSGNYLSREDSVAVAKRVIKEIGGKPVAFFDVLEDFDEDGNGFYNPVIGVDHNEQGKGYGAQVAKIGMKYVDKLMEENGKDVVWGVRADNEASIAIAKKNGFEYEEGSEKDGWVNYVKKHELKHHGIKGQKWGIKHGPPYPIEPINKNRIIERSKNKTAMGDRPHTDYNIDKWGNSKDTNILWVTGMTGSGKSTMAKQMAEKNNADLIDLDLYTFKTTNKYNDQMSKEFNRYLDKQVPNWRKKQAKAYEVLTKNDRRKMKAAGEWFDTLEGALKNYGESQYGNKKVVAEGVQILDETLFYNNKQGLKGQPVIIMDTSVEESLVSRALRDNKDINKLLEPERIKQYETWVNGMDIIKKEMG